MSTVPFVPYERDEAVGTINSLGGDLKKQANHGRWLRAQLLLVTIAASLYLQPALAQKLSGTELAHALRQGGYVLVVRNGRSPAQPPAEERQRAPANLHGEREIDEYGQGQMGVIGYALRELEVPVDSTLTSPAYRSRQSGNYFGLGQQTVVEMLAETADPAWLAKRLTEAPPPGKNTVIVTHGSLIAKAVGSDAHDIGTGETLVFRPDAKGFEFVARLTVAEWARLTVH